jgi:hypothetical protein
VLLKLTTAGRAHLDDYVDAGASRERELMEDLTQTEKQRLNQLLSKWLDTEPRRRRPEPDRSEHKRVFGKATTWIRRDRALVLARPRRVTGPMQKSGVRSAALPDPRKGNTLAAR